MRFETRLIGGTVPKAVQWVNDRGVQRFVFQFLWDDTYKCVEVIFRFDDYPGYCHFCERTGTKPKPVSEFFGMETPACSP